MRDLRPQVVLAFRTSTSATEGRALWSVRNTGPVLRPAGSRAVPVCHTITSRAPPFRVTTARRFAVSRAGYIVMADPEGNEFCLD